MTNEVDDSETVPEIDLTDFEVVTGEKQDLNPTDEVRPDITSPQWSDYVLSQFEPDELYEGKPTCDGLRRVAEALLGPIYISKSKFVTQNVSSAVVIEHTIVIDTEYGRRQYTAIADVSEANTEKPFLNYPFAVAATRAEAICLRKLLKLRRVIAAEEGSGYIAVQQNSTITSTQKSFINMMARRTNVDAWKLINGGKEKYKCIDDVPFEKSVEIQSYLNKIQSGEVKLSTKFKGYKENWLDENSISS